MTKLVDYEVVREHQGDKITDDGTVVHLFQPGEIRTADPNIVAHLIPNTLAEPEGSKAKGKAEKGPPENKAEGNAPENKAEKSAATKQGE